LRSCSLAPHLISFAIAPLPSAAMALLDSAYCPSPPSLTVADAQNRRLAVLHPQPGLWRTICLLISRPASRWTSSPVHSQRRREARGLHDLVRVRPLDLVRISHDLSPHDTINPILCFS
jgi:hypothetical protein